MQNFSEGLGWVLDGATAAWRSPFFAVAVGSVAVFLIIWQRLHIRELRRREERFLRAQDRSVPHSSWQDPLFADAPFPAALATRRGDILWGNASFWKRFRDMAGNLADFDRATGSNLSDLTGSGTKAHHLHLSLPDDKDRRRLFTVMTWPVRQPGGTSTLFAFFEQTAVERRKQSDAGFEQQLIGYLQGVRQQLDAENGSELAILEAKTELETLLGLLDEHHGALRSATAHGKVNLPSVWKEVFEPVAAVLRDRKVRATVTLPHDAWVIAHREDAVRAVRLVLEAAADLMQPGMGLHVSMERSGRGCALSLTVPELVLPERQLNLLFSFGMKVKRTTRIAALQLKLALARQLATKYHGRLEAVSADGIGTTFKLIFASAA